VGISSMFLDLVLYISFISSFGIFIDLHVTYKA